MNPTNSIIEDDPVHSETATVQPTDVAGSGKKMTDFWRMSLLLVAALLPFLPALRYGFVFDDDTQVLQNLAVRHLQTAKTYYLTSIWMFRDSAIPLNPSYYRPLFYSWLRLNTALFGDHSFSWHFSAILNHLAVTLLVFFLLRRLVRNPWAATLGAMIFAVHPIHLESVAWVSGATDPLMTIGVLGAFLLWLKNLEKPSISLLAGSLACYGAALLCKETAIALPVVLFLHVLLGIGGTNGMENGTIRRAKRGMQEAFPFLAVTAAYFAVRFAVLREPQGTAPAWVSTTHAILTAPGVLAFYLQKLVWPFSLRLFYDFQVVQSASSARFWAPVLILGLLAAGFWLLWKRSQDKAILAGVAWLVIPILPVLNIQLFHRDDFIHDRYLYLPSVGLAILASVAANRILDWKLSERPRTLLTACVTLVIGVLAAVTLTQSVVWQDDFSLYKQAARNSSNTMALLSLATQFALHGRTVEAKRMLDSVVRERPDFWLANYDLGCVEYQLRDMDSAAKYLDIALAQNPNGSDIYLNRSLVYLRQGQRQNSIEMMHRAIAINPVRENYHLTLGLILAGDRHDLEIAKAELRTELKYHPSNGIAQMQLDKMEHLQTGANPAQSASY